MKTIDYYMNLPYKLEIVPDLDEGGYIARYPELPGCITVGNSLEETVRNVLDAKREWLTAALEDGNTINEPISLEEYSGQFKLRIPKSLHRSLAEHSKAEGISMNQYHSKAEGISMNQYCLYLLTKNDTLEKA